MTYILSCFNTGQITLPKKWRDLFPGKKYVAEETDEGLLIKPFPTGSSIKNIKFTYFDNNKEEGIIFQDGIDPEDLAKIMDEVDG